MTFILHPHEKVITCVSLLFFVPSFFICLSILMNTPVKLACLGSVIIKPCWSLLCVCSAKVNCQLVIILSDLPKGKVLFLGSVEIRQIMLKSTHYCISILTGFSEESILVLLFLLASKLHLAHRFEQSPSIRDLQVVTSVIPPMGRSGSPRRTWATMQRQREDITS